MSAAQALGKYLDDLRQRHGLRSDAALCVRIGVEPPRMSRLRGGFQLMSPYIMLRIHEGLGEPVADIRAALPLEAFGPEAQPYTAPPQIKTPPRWTCVDPERLLRFIGFAIGEGAAPTLQEMADHFGVALTSIDRAVQGLADQGALIRHRGRSRGLELAL